MKEHFPQYGNIRKVHCLVHNSLKVDYIINHVNTTHASFLFNKLHISPIKFSQADSRVWRFIKSDVSANVSIIGVIIWHRISFAPFIYSWMAWLVGVSEPIGVGGRSSKIAVILLVASCSSQSLQYGLPGPAKHEHSIPMASSTRRSMHPSALTSLCVSLNFRVPFS
jgi:hypothetical protein